MLLHLATRSFTFLPGVGRELLSMKASELASTKTQTEQRRRTRTLSFHRLQVCSVLQRRRRPAGAGTSRLKQPLHQAEAALA